MLVYHRGNRRTQRTIPFRTLTYRPPGWRDIIAFELRHMRQLLRRWQ